MRWQVTTIASFWLVMSFGPPHAWGLQVGGDAAVHPTVDDAAASAFELPVFDTFVEAELPYVIVGRYGKYHDKSPRRPVRRLLGDWEEPEMLILTYTGSWTVGLEAIVASVPLEVPMVMLVNPDDWLEAQTWRDSLATKRVWMMEVRHDSPWVRDWGPMQTHDIRGRPLWLDARYRGSRPLDDAVPKHLARELWQPSRPLNWALDGGALVSNGRGLCAMSWKNYFELEVGMEDDPEVHHLLAKLGCDILAVVPSVEGESTGHIDLTVHFFSPSRVGVAWMDPALWPENAKALDLVVEGLQAAAKTAGITLDVERVPMTRSADDAFYSYLNVVNLKDRLLVPLYEGVPEALQQLAYERLEAASGLPLAPIAAESMISSGGAIHCMLLGVRLSPTARRNEYRKVAMRQATPPRRGGKASKKARQ